MPQRASSSLTASSEIFSSHGGTCRLGGGRGEVGNVRHWDQRHYPALFRTHVATTPKASRDATQRASGRRCPTVSPPRTATASTEQVPAWRSLLLASPSGGGTLVAACTTRGGTSAPQPDDLCTIATFVARIRQTTPAPCSTFHLMHALWTTVLSHRGFFASVGVCTSLHGWYPMCGVPLKSPWTAAPRRRGKST
jgi:hypothetical protein